MKYLLIFWIACTLLLGYEYSVLNSGSGQSLISVMQSKGFISQKYEINSAPGRTLSLFLGWTGLSLMIIMNVYSMRKRIGWMQGMGKLSGWLNFHIFCGLLGPTLILFHCNFKVRGLVGISFWSMVVSFSSGIIGRYFYVQLLKDRKQFFDAAEKIESSLKLLLEKKINSFNVEKLQLAKATALVHVGLPNGTETELNPIASLWYSMIGDIRLRFQDIPIEAGWPVGAKYLLAEMAMNIRRGIFLSSFQRLMGYWHTFHFPFAIFMYIVAVIHVVAALVLGV